MTFLNLEKIKINVLLKIAIIVRNAIDSFFILNLMIISFIFKVDYYKFENHLLLYKLYFY